MAKKLEAKVKDELNIGPVAAFSGREYIRKEWRPVPVGCEAEALRHTMLDVREVAKEAAVMAPEHYLTEVPTTAPEPVSMETADPEPLPEETPEPKKRSRKSSKKEE
jgi:hypothetical protein